MFSGSPLAESPMYVVGYELFICMDGTLVFSQFMTMCILVGNGRTWNSRT